MEMKGLARYLGSERLLSLMAALVLSGCFSSGEPAAEKPTRRTVEVATVEAADQNRTVTLSGRVRAAEQASLSFEVGGKLQHLELDIGDAIEAGQVLARLEAAPYRLALQRARASASEAAAQWQEQRLNFQRQSVLRERNMISQSSLDEAEAALDMARARKESAQASLAIAERDLEQTALIAPFNGSISRRLAESFERVSPGQSVYGVISDRNGFEVQTHLPENLVNALVAGQPHRVSFPALDNVSLAAQVSHVGRQPSSANSYPVLLKPELEDGLALRSGMTALITLTLREEGVPPGQAGWLKVPLSALRYPNDQSVQVLRVNRNNTLEAVGVSVRSTREDSALVTGELAPGQTVVARGVDFVSPGESVAVLGRGPERYY
ncbi:efflux RND transporter periplasmic adaptor subunit [Marinimicrobium locisalis]|uniref:efflux RND transporter periplasmic adaptor subunit n=1 Tax=Marinimicrobium locisalis TaxID=546022 RepID=UPI003221915D